MNHTCQGNIYLVSKFKKKIIQTLSDRTLKTFTIVPKIIDRNRAIVWYAVGTSIYMADAK